MSAPRPVLHVISGLRTGGAEGALVNLARELSGRGLPQHVVSLTPDGPNEAPLRAMGADVHVIAPRGPLGAPAALARLTRLAARLDPAVIQGWLYHGDLFAAGAHRLAGGRARRVLAWGLRNADIDSGRYGRLIALGARLSRWPDVVIANARGGADFHLAQGYRPRRLAIVPNGIDTERFRPDPGIRAAARRRLGLPEDAVVAIHSARVDPMKDHATLFSAMRRCSPGLRLVLLGSGTETLDRPPGAIALGRVDRPEEILPAGDIAVSSSAFGEGFSNALAEGMAAGLVPVATQVGDARTVVGGTGPLVTPRDPAALADALAGLATLPAAQRAARGREARAHIVRHFGIPAMADGFLAAWSARDTAHGT